MTVKELIEKLNTYPADMELSRMNEGIGGHATFYTPVTEVFVDERSTPEKLVVA